MADVVDLFPVSKAAPLNLSELGDSGLKHSWGLVQEEFLVQLQGYRAIQVYKEMRDNDPTVGAMLYAFEMLMRRVPWSVEGSNARFLESVMDDMSHTWDDFIAEALSMLPFGFSFHEIVYKRRDDGRIGWKKLPIRAQESLCRWEFDTQGGVEGVYQKRHDSTEVFIPIEKGLLFRTGEHKGNPEGKSILRTAYRPWWFKKRIEEIEAIGIERDLAGIPVFYVPAEMMASDAGSDFSTTLEEFKKIGRNLRNDEQACLVLPQAYDENSNPLYKFELAASAGRRQFVTGDVLERYARQIAMSSMADVILLGHESVGSFALSQSKTSLFMLGLQAQLEQVASVVNKYAIPRLWALNGLNPQNAPKVVAGELTNVEAKDFAEIIWKLTMAGMPLFPDHDLEGYIRRVLDLPEASGEAEARPQVTAPPGAGAQGQGDQGVSVQPSS